MRIITITCAQCGKSSDKPARYIEKCIRQGREHFFCNLQCYGIYQRTVTPKNRVIKIITKVCAHPNCDNTFDTLNDSDERDFCSRSCANSRPHSQETIEKIRQRSKTINHSSDNNFGIDITANSLRSREWWKYSELNRYLTSHQIEHWFEFPLQDYIYDLYIPLISLLVEFDGPCHKIKEQQWIDKLKTNLATQYCCKLIRLEDTGSSIDPHCLDEYISSIM